MNKNTLKSDRGVALILALGLLVIIAAVALIVVTTSILEQGMSTAERQQKVVFDAMQQGMERSIRDMNPKVDLADTNFFYTKVDTLPYMGGGNYRIVTWMGQATDTLPMRVSVRPVDFPRGMHQVGDPIYIQYAQMHASARMYRTGSTQWVAQKQADVTVDVGPYGWQP